MFKISENNSKVSSEIIGGIITFLAMVYILPVNSNILKDMGMSLQGVFASTALVSGLVTIFMGFFANYPVALSAGMGLNAFIAYTVCMGLGFNWQECMILLLFSGMIFFLLSMINIRQKIIDAFPKELRLIISAGLGAFIFLIGIKGAGIISSNPATLVQMGDFSKPEVIIALLGCIFVFYLSNAKGKLQKVSKFSIPLGMIAVATIGALGYYIGFEKFGNEAFKGLPHFSGQWGVAGLKDVMFFGLISDEPGVNKDFFGMVQVVLKNPLSYIAIFSLIFVNLFDTTATLMTVCREISKEKEVDMGRIIIADATGALVCAPLGTSTITSFAEASVGVSFGARTGLAAVVSGLCFLAAIFIFPVFSIFTYYSATAPALMAVGTMIFISNIREMLWDDAAINTTMVVTIIFVLFTYSLTNGIGLGLLFYIFCRLAQKRLKEVNPILIWVGIFFVISIIASHIV